MNTADLDVNAIPGNVQTVRVFDVDYLHVNLRDGSDLYVTEYGLPFIYNLLPENFWTDHEWFSRNSFKLFGDQVRSSGTSTIYRVRTKPVRGRCKDIVVKWNRMGQDVPGERDVDELLTAEFNSPYEEFALVMEMRNAWRASSRSRILTHKPFAVYVPAETVELERTGRREHKMKAKMSSHPDIDLDMLRPYAVIYEWIDGIDLAEACHLGVTNRKDMIALTRKAEEHMRDLGFVVRDGKPHHVIVRLDPASGLKRTGEGFVPYAVVDFELLERTPEREEMVKKSKRQEYLRRQAHRFDAETKAVWPTHLVAVNILGVDYIFGPAESTGGRLWVVGKDPGLFDYFLPERWEHTPRTRLSNIDEVYETVTKDNIHVVWRISRVGQRPDADPFKPEDRRILEYGYNSPFEEVSLALELNRKGIPATLPRAVYESGHSPQAARFLSDESRYKNHKDLRLFDGSQALRKDRDYIVVWGYWNKPDEMLAAEDRDYYAAVDALQALRDGIINEKAYMSLMHKIKDRLSAAGMEDLDLRGNHKLLSLDSTGMLLTDSEGFPQARICNFELMKQV